ncbi:DNA-binding transcriptional LysR family regulator [Constrictibacter sp. MBR-5]|jgi:DNA-binding transcriptional LysR family regulator|uniref:LysR family transcriptional regulator n=1 Tax=Constrictibacter sp. MBR-5 TaxID=3156467 RepID=UPI0033990A9A
MDPDLKSMAVFVAVAETRSFRAAADRLGVTRSAVSQAINGMEMRLGIALFHRTTRSVNLTEAGRRLHAAVAPAMAEIDAALRDTVDLKDRPKGQLRLAVSSIAEGFLSGPLLAGFAARFPDVEIDILVTDEECDIVAEGFDAGVRLGEVIEQDMIAIPVSGDQRQLPVCAPAYLDGVDPPRHPRDLVRHRCIGWRPSPGSAPYRWEFAENGREFDVAVAPEFTTNDMGLMIRLAVSGAGITFGMEESFRPWLARGALVPLLEPFCPSFPGFFLYFSSRRNVAPKLRALADFVKSR